MESTDDNTGIIASKRTMSELVNPQNTIEVIQKHGFNFQKKFGQNFLIDPHVLEKIVAAAEITKEDTVLEIGPGIGTMTQRLAEAAGKVIAVEIDDNLIPILKETLAAYDNIEIIHGDIMKMDIPSLGATKVVANLPYYITTPIIMGIFESGAPVQSVTVMVQKEVADRMKSGPGTKDYGALSLAVQYYAQPYLAANVPQNCFMPRPKVGSAVIRLTRHKAPPVQVHDEKLMFQIIRAAFNQRRKTLQNCIGNDDGLNYEKADVAATLEAMGLSVNIRGEALSLEEFAGFTDKIEKIH